MPNTDQLRVVRLCGRLPVDPACLERAAESVDLRIYVSRWFPTLSGQPSTPAPDGVPLRQFSPVLRSGRGQLAFVYRGLHRALDRDQPDVIHVVSEPWGLLAAQAAAWVRRNPRARLVLHGCDTKWHHGNRLEKSARRALLRYTLPRIDAWLAENSKALELAAENGLPSRSIRQRIHTNPRNGDLFRVPHDAERERARRLLGISPGQPAIALLGRLVPEKGVIEFLDAAEMLLARGFPGQFMIAGDGPLYEEVRRRTTPQLRILGRLAHPDGVVQLFRALDVLACPSLCTPSWEEQGSRSLLEAMMSGCIPVGTATGAIPEMLGGHGVLTDTTTSAALADAIVSATERAANQRAREHLAGWAHSLYSADAVADQLVRLWHLVAAQAPATGHGRVSTCE